jgi:hypothetical protein
MEELPEDISQAIQLCKEFQRQRPNTPADPPVFLVEACGEKAVCMPPSFEGHTRLQKLMGNVLNDKREMIKYLETYCAETLFWVRGQSGTGRDAAIQYLRAQAKSDFSKFGLIAQVAAEVQSQLDAAEVVTTSKKF